MFKFKLDKVLKFRSMMVDAESLKLREIQQQQLHIQNQILRQDVLIKNMINDYDKVKTDTSSINSWSLMYDAVTKEKNIIAEMRDQEQILHGQHQQQMFKLVEAQQEKASLQKLKDKQLAEWNEVQRRREQRMMDELASNAHYQLS
jgi:flagellar protein FliJ